MASSYSGGRLYLLLRRCLFLPLIAISFYAQIKTAQCADSDVTIEVQVVSTSATSSANPASASIMPATHQQAKFITPAPSNENLKLASFCVIGDGRLVAVLDRQEAAASVYGSAFITILNVISSDSSAESKSESPPSVAAAKQPDSVAELRILDGDGKLLSQWPLDFKAQAVNVCPNGNLVIGGTGVLGRYDLEGKELARIESPHIVAARKDPEKIKEQAREMAQQQRDSYKQTIKSLESQLEEIAKKDEASLTREEKQTKQQLDQQLTMYRKVAGNQVDRPVSEAEVEQMMQFLNEQSKRINAIAGNEKYIFCTAPASKGYGYSVWRTDLDFGNPQRIVDGLSGCCGQMDIQCCGDDIVVAENSRKRVVRYDAEGKLVDSWGKASRDEDGDSFGSCCNPMNTRPVGDKLYVSDSDGRVRIFTLDGAYASEVGKADVSPGCKSSIVGISPSGDRLYYIDVNNSRICVLDRIAAAEQSTH